MTEYFYGPDPPLYKALKLAREIESILIQQISELERDLLWLAVSEPAQVKRLSDLKASLVLFQEARFWIAPEEREGE